MTFEAPVDDADQEGDDRSYWLMKAEPDSRIVKGIDVKFSIDDLRAAEAPEPWDGKSLHSFESQTVVLILHG